MNNKYINRVLQNEHILNFMDNTSIKLPRWFNNFNHKDNKLYGGDLDCVIVSNEILFKYNVFYVYPSSMGSNEKTYKFIYKNIEELNKIRGENNYLICLIDIKNKEQISLFEQIFKDFFVKYKSSSHTPNFDFETINIILKNNGKYILQNNAEFVPMSLLELKANIEIIEKSKNLIQILPHVRLISNKLISENNKYNNYPSNIDIIQYYLYSSILSLYENYVLSKFRLSKSFEEIYEYLLNKYSKNKYFLILYLYKIYYFLLLNIKSKLPLNIIAVYDVINYKYDIIFIKKDQTNLNNFYG
jgi:hypothetical protein